MHLNCLFSFAAYPQKCQKHFLYEKKGGNRSKHVSSQENDRIFHIFDQIKVSKIPM